MSTKAWRIGVLVVGVLVVASLAFSSGLAVGLIVPRLTSESASPPLELSQPSVASSGDSLGNTAPVDRDTLLAPFWEAWDILQRDFIDQPIDDVQLMRGAISGMVGALGDPHTAYMDPDEYMQANLPLDGEYEGIGAWVDTDGPFLTIVSAMPGSPAEQAGLQPGDQVIAVDGEDMSGMDGNLVIREVLGPAGTTVTLTIRREGEADSFEVEIVRQKITLPSVEAKMLDGDVAYLRLYTFGAQTSGDLERELRDLMRQDPTGLILDLRGNGGGFLNTAVEVASQFIGDREVVLIERFGDGDETVYRADPGGLATDLPMIVLIDGGSASASEIVAGAIQDHGRGRLVGETSFGKGSVQNWVPLSDEQGAVRVTIARWYTPNDRQIQGTGLAPDVEVAAPEDLSDLQDPQLDKALELLLGANAQSQN